MITKLSHIVSILFILFLAGMPCSLAEERKTVQYDLGKGIQVTLDEPVVVSMSKVGEKRWGYFQFVGISEYPGDKILIRFHAGADAVEAYGTPMPTYISHDKGTTWTKFKTKGLPPTGMTYPVFKRHFICIPMAKPLNIRTAKLTLPKSAGKFYSYSWFTFYRLAECPLALQTFFANIEGARWVPQYNGWRKDMFLYDKNNALIWVRKKGKASNLIARTVFERPPLKVGNELIYADYRTSYLQPDGSVPKQWGVTCMVSKDNGRSWKRRSTIALDSKGGDALTESMLAENASGELVCVIRRADQKQKSMMITFSKDKGHTWEKPTDLNQLGDFGVMPCIIRLKCGIMVLSYGRPGIWFSFSLNGQGREWTKPVCMLKKKLSNRVTDGYTAMLPLSPEQLLFAYTHFNHKDAQGKQRKAVLVRKLTVKGMD